MTEYYKTQQMVYQRLNAMLKSGAELDLNKVILDLTLEYPISELAIKKRIERLAQCGVVKKIDNVILVV